MGFAIGVVAYFAGVFILGGGVWLIMQGAFPAWWRRVSWPVLNPSRGVARLQGIGLVALGVSVIALVVTAEFSTSLGRVLIYGAVAAYLVGLALFAVSTWMSRRKAT